MPYPDKFSFFFRPDELCHEKICLHGFEIGLKLTHTLGCKMARGMKFQILKVVGMFYSCRENALISCSATAQLFRLAKTGFLMTWIKCEQQPGRSAVNPCRLTRTLVVCCLNMSLVMRKPDFCICENKGADQLCGNRTTDQHLCFRYTDSTIPLLFKSEISSLWPSSVAVQPGFVGLVVNPEDRFSHKEAHIYISFLYLKF